MKFLVDCAYGYQKENEEAGEIKENCQQEGDANQEAGSKKDENSQAEIGEEEAGCEKGGKIEECRQENNRREGGACP
jgi:hypothetical protein